MNVNIDFEIKKLEDGHYQGKIVITDTRNVTIQDYLTDPDYNEYKECLYDTKQILDTMIDEIASKDDED